MFIEARLAAVDLDGGDPPTLIVPPPAGKVLAKDKEIEAALAAALNDELTSNLFSGSFDELIREISEYKPAKTGNYMTVATTAILAAGGDPVTVVAARLELAAKETTIPNPKGAATVVKNAIKVIATPGNVNDGSFSDITEFAVANAAIFADKIVAGAIGSATKMDPAEVADEMREITKEAVQEAIANGADYLLDEILAAAAKAAKGLTSVANLVNAALIDAGNVANTPEQTALVVLGIGRGLNSAAVTDAVAAANVTRPAHANYVTKAGEGFFEARAAGSPAAAPSALEAYIDAVPGTAGDPASRRENLAALVAGATAAWQSSAPTFVQVGLDNDAQYNSGDTTEEIVRAVVLANQASAAKIATAAVGHGDATNETQLLGQIAKGAVEGAQIGVAGAVVGATIKATGTITQANVEEIVTFAVNGAEIGKIGAITDIARDAAKASKLAGVVVTAAVQAAPVGETYRAVIGAIVADKKNAIATRNAGLAASLVDDDEAISKGADVAMNILNDSKNFYNRTLTALIDAGNDTQIETEAIVTGASYANPKGAAAIASAAIAIESFSTVAIIDAAKNANRKAATNIDLATQAAIHVKGNNGSDLFEYIEKLVFQNPKFAPDIATGAVVVLPQYAHITGHAAAFRSASAAGKVVPVLFAYAQLDDFLQNNLDDPSAAAAAIMAGVTCGVLEAKIDPVLPSSDPNFKKKEKAAISAAVSAAVKAALVLDGPAGGFATSDGTASGTTQFLKNGPAGVTTGFVSQLTAPGENTLSGGATGVAGAAITAAVKAAKTHALAIAQAAATAAATVSGAAAGYNVAAIVQAVVNAGSAFTQPQIQNAANYGKQQAILGNPGAGAAGVVNYAHHTCVGDPVTSIFDL